MDGRKKRGQLQQYSIQHENQAAEAWLSSSAEFLLANYDLGRKIGNGSFGVVRLAQHKLTSHPVAVKIISKRKLQEKDPNSEDKLRREIKILSMLHHPHILRMYEIIETPEHIYIVTEYVEGGELFDHITRVGRLAEPEARHLFQQMIAGIEYCHRHMVVHRDLKPENLLLDGRNNIKIIDFGLSNVMQEGYFLKTSCGSFNYAAPEVIKGARYAGPEVDVWSSGVVLYALLCGVLPFNDDMQQGIPYVLRKILAGTYSIPHWVSPQAQDLIARMLRVDPLQRITVTEIKQHPWFRFNLPRYVALVSEDGAPAESSVRHALDETALLQAQALGFSRDVVLQSLEHSLRNKAAVTYWLLADALQRQRAATAFGRATISPASVVNLVKAQGLLPLDSHDDPSCILQQRLVVERVYRLGVRSTAHPFSIMSEVVRVLLQMGIAWKKSGRYCLRCRCLVLPAHAGAMLAITDSMSQCPPAASHTAVAAAAPPQLCNGLHTPSLARSDPCLQPAASAGLHISGAAQPAAAAREGSRVKNSPSTAAMDVDSLGSSASGLKALSGTPRGPSVPGHHVARGHNGPPQEHTNGLHSPVPTACVPDGLTNGCDTSAAVGRCMPPGEACGVHNAKVSGRKQGPRGGPPALPSAAQDTWTDSNGAMGQGRQPYDRGYAPGRASATAVTRAFENCNMSHTSRSMSGQPGLPPAAHVRPPLSVSSAPIDPTAPQGANMPWHNMAHPAIPLQQQQPFAGPPLPDPSLGVRPWLGHSQYRGVAGVGLPMVALVAPNAVPLYNVPHGMPPMLQRQPRHFQVVPGVRLPNGELGPDPSGCHVLRFELQLFKARDGVYILDFHRLQGPNYMVLDLLARMTQRLHL